jgi:VanZ family protein
VFSTVTAPTEQRPPSEFFGARKRLAAGFGGGSVARVTQPSSTISDPARSISKRAVLWPLVLMALIFFASSSSKIAAPNVSGIDKFGHFMVYGWLGVLWARVPWVTRLKPLGAWTAVAIASLYGITDEFHQSFTPGRGVEFADWMADTAGALVAVTIYARWHGLRLWLERGLFARS